MPGSVIHGLWWLDGDDNLFLWLRRNSKALNLIATLIERQTNIREN
jgi:hypothetical protein